MDEGGVSITDGVRGPSQKRGHHQQAPFILLAGGVDTVMVWARMRGKVRAALVVGVTSHNTHKSLLMYFQEEVLFPAFPCPSWIHSGTSGLFPELLGPKPLHVA